MALHYQEYGNESGSLYEESCKIISDTLVRVLEENLSYKIPKDFKKANGY